MYNEGRLTKLGELRVDRDANISKRQGKLRRFERRPFVLAFTGSGHHYQSDAFLLLAAPTLAQIITKLVVFLYLNKL